MWSERFPLRSGGLDVLSHGNLALKRLFVLIFVYFAQDQKRDDDQGVTSARSRGLSLTLTLTLTLRLISKLKFLSREMSSVPPLFQSSR